MEQERREGNEKHRRPKTTYHVPETKDGLDQLTTAK
jgi:hypothetical protein